MIAIKSISLSLVILFSMLTLKAAESGAQDPSITSECLSHCLHATLHDVASLAPGSENDIEAHQLVQQGATIHYSHLHQAIYSGNLPLFQALLSKAKEQTPDGILVAEAGWGTLHCACHCANVDMVGLLLEAGADINSNIGDTHFPSQSVESFHDARHLSRTPLFFAVYLMDRVDKRKQIMELLYNKSKYKSVLMAINAQEIAQNFSESLSTSLKYARGSTMHQQHFLGHAQFYTEMITSLLVYLQKVAERSAQS